MSYALHNIAALEAWPPKFLPVSSSKRSATRVSSSKASSSNVDDEADSPDEDEQAVQIKPIGKNSKLSAPVIINSDAMDVDDEVDESEENSDGSEDELVKKNDDEKKEEMEEAEHVEQHPLKQVGRPSGRKVQNEDDEDLEERSPEPIRRSARRAARNEEEEDIEVWSKGKRNISADVSPVRKRRRARQVRHLPPHKAPPDVCQFFLYEADVAQKGN
ncbi:hypothetical protein HDU93_008417 [Gonapodya sp. JEL0774]|nr:hypothetical protein HDU93_008417 [Gonapodya sp. JEL0774]